MPSIFLSYSRVDLTFVETLYGRLQRMRPNDHIWYDKAPDGLLGGDSWWDQILDAIANADIFIYVLSNESVQSEYCKAEFEEARRLQKRIITIQARDRTKLTGALSDIQYVDMKNGVNDPDALVGLSGALDRQASQVKKRRALWRPRTQKPSEEKPISRDESAPEVDTPTLQIPHDPQTQSVSNIPFLPIMGMVILAIIVVVVGVALNNAGTQSSITPTAITEVADKPTETVSITPSQTEEAAIITSPTQIPTNTATLSGTEYELTVQSQISEIQTEAAETVSFNQTATPAMATAQAQMTVYAQATAFAHQTATASQWTATFTPDTRATAETRLTQDSATQIAVATDNAISTATQQVLDLTATATLWTATFTPSNTPTLSPEEIAKEIAKTPVVSNADWTAYEQEFDAVPMMLVPVGCFMMGSNDGESDEQPVHKQCLDAPFWIDKYEVTQGDFERLGGTKARENGFDGVNRPVENITWFEARDFCESRGGRLPTEKEWEYAARGPDNLIYPWGNEWNGNYAVFIGSSDNQTAEVARGPSESASWVGAYDMSGNVWEWVSSLYQNYEYDSTHENEIDRINIRVMRGGSFSNPMVSLRSADRSGNNPNSGYYSVGFRCARDG